MYLLNIVAQWSGHINIFGSWHGRNVAHNTHANSTRISCTELLARQLLIIANYTISDFLEGGHWIGFDLIYSKGLS